MHGSVLHELILIWYVAILILIHQFWGRLETGNLVSRRGTNFLPHYWRLDVSISYIFIQNSQSLFNIVQKSLKVKYCQKLSNFINLLPFKTDSFGIF